MKRYIYTRTDYHGNVTVLDIVCPFCLKNTQIQVKTDLFNEYEKGMRHIQDIFPMLTARERELLLSGMCYDCQDKFFEEEAV